MALLDIEKIKIDGGTQTRVELNLAAVGEYHEKMTEGETFPPIVVFFDGSEHWLADGFHRYHAARKGEFKDIESDIRPGTRRDAVLFSVGANAGHGLRRTNADKRRAVETLLADEEWAAWSNREIARRVAVGHTFVDKVRPSLPSVGSDDDARTFTTKHGTVATMNTANIGKKKTEPAPIETPAPEPEGDLSPWDEEPTQSAEPERRDDEEERAKACLATLKPRPISHPPMDPIEALRHSRFGLYESVISDDKHRIITAANNAIDAIDRVMATIEVAQEAM